MDPITLLITDTQGLHLAPPLWLDKVGNDAPVQEGSLTFTPSDPAALIIAPSTVDDGGVDVLLVQEAGHLGNFQVVARADADKGDGDEPVTAILNLTVVGGKAVTGTMRPGTPYEQV
jgi:hypothetical protein